MGFKAILALLKETWAKFQQDEALQLSAALAYYALFSLFPLLLLLVALLGYVLAYLPSAQDAQSTLLAGVASNFSPELSDTLAQVLGGVKSQAGAATGIGLVTLLLGASGVFQQLDTSFNKIWKMPTPTDKLTIIDQARQFLSQKLTSFVMVLAVGFLLIVSTTLTGLTQTLLNGAGVLIGLPSDSPLAGLAGILAGIAVTLVLNTLIFALLYKYLPDAKVRWSDIWLGAVTTAIIWEIAKRLLAIYIGGIGKSSAAYGAIGAVLVLVAWIYFSSLVLYLGAELTYVYAHQHGSLKAPEPASSDVPQAATVNASMDASAALTYNQRISKATGRGFIVGAISGVVAALALIVGGGVLAYNNFKRALRRGA